MLDEKGKRGHRLPGVGIRQRGDKEPLGKTEMASSEGMNSDGLVLSIF
jgi:hypothetical protein